MTRMHVLYSVCLAVLLASCSKTAPESGGGATSNSTKPVAAEPAKPTAPDRVVMETSMGKIIIELNRNKAPMTVDNFLAYVDKGFYSGTIFHRVIPNFMIQGGGMEPGMKEKATRTPIQNEAKNGLKNARGTIAMARTGNPHSATAQFFINVVDNAGLDYPGQDGWGYCVFGKVIEGMDTVDKIKAVQTGNAGPHQNVPKADVIIRSVVRQK